MRCCVTYEPNIYWIKLYHIAYLLTCITVNCIEFRGSILKTESLWCQILLSSLLAIAVVMMTTFCCTNEDKVGIRKFPVFRPPLLIYCCHCPACRTTLVATRFRVAVICPIIQVPHCIRVFFYFVWFVFINHIFQFYYELCTYCNILDIYLS